jgi:sugar O-acyltransferase (sialic acid O-acetyltransferase NeuD family)
MTRSLVILGTGGGAHDILDVIEATNATSSTWEVAGFLDDDRASGSQHLGFKVLGRLGDAACLEGHYFINVIGSDKSYRRRPEILTSTGFVRERFATLVHPAALISSRVRLGHGTCIGFGVSVGGGALVGDHVTLCPGSIIGHDSVIEDYAIVAPGAVISGLVRLGRNCYIGAGAMIRQRLQIGEQSLVGMGAVVTRDVEGRSIVLGNPARSV